MKLSDHLTLEEFTHSDTAIKKGIKNELPDELLDVAKYTALNLFEPIRELLGVPLKVDSGYRCSELNVAVRGVPTSQHTKAEAIDLVPMGMDINKAFEIIRKSSLVFDQLIKEHCGKVYWIHASIREGHNRQQVIANLEKR